MRRFYAVAGWALVALGLVHVMATFHFYRTFNAQALWFLGGGLLMIVVAALNLLNRTYGHIAPGLRTVCIAANFAMLVFAVAVGLLTRASVAGWIVVLGIVGSLTVLSCLRAVDQRDAT